MAETRELQWEVARSIPARWWGDWNELTRTQSPIADAEWVSTFISAFATSDWCPRIHIAHRDGELVAAIPLVPSAGLASAWTSLDNEHHPYWLLAGELDAATAERVLLALLADERGRDYLFLRRLHLESPTCLALRTAAEQLGLHVCVIQSAMGDARTRIDGSWDAFRTSLPRGLRDHLPNARRQLERRGALELVSFDAPGPALTRALHECFVLETRGWKGVRGSPILHDRRTHKFYGQLAPALASTGRFALFQLRYEGNLIAFQYCLRGAGHVELLKESYDPTFASKSPSHLLRLLLLEELFARGEPGYYHMGRATVDGDARAEWKLRWATEVAPLCTLRIYGGGLRARMAYVSGPVLRTAVKQSRLVAAARSAARQLQRGITRARAGWTSATRLVPNRLRRASPSA